uniref:ARAD1D08052p n=1 Tax=Blastobotrys adeninivorans TaxID=409370 RepID=A0A060T8L4_BLAAD
MSATYGRARARGRAASGKSKHASPAAQKKRTQSATPSSTEDLYSSVISAIADSGETAPDANTLRQVQGHLNALIANSDNRIAACDAELQKLDRLNEAIARERSQRGNKKPQSKKKTGKAQKAASKSRAHHEPEEDVEMKEAEPEVKEDHGNKMDQDGDEVIEKDADHDGEDKDNDNDDDTKDLDQDQGQDSDAKADADGETVQLTERDANETPSGQVTDLTGFQDQRRYSDQESPKEYEKNPKSEFVESQELPISALGLFEDTVDGLPQTGEEYLKKKYGVASYPTTDLKDLLPGEIPDQDFTRSKPSNQVQFTTFASAIEPFFRSYTEEDLSFLNQKAVGGDSAYNRPGVLSPHVIPPLGPSYVQTWAEEDGPNPGYSLSGAHLNQGIDAKYVAPLGSEDSVTDSTLEEQSVSCGPLASRLLSAILTEAEPGDSIDIKTEDGDDSTARNGAVSLVDPTWKVAAAKADYASLEERLQREFKYVGILDAAMLRTEDKKKQSFKVANPSTAKKRPGSELDDEVEIDWINSREDDEISYELRMLQKKLRTLTRINQACKRQLIPLVEEQMAYQEYGQILEDLDRQVDQAYVKRVRNPKNKKKKTATSSTTGVGTPGGTGAGTPAPNGSVPDQQKSNIRSLLDKRQRWIQRIGPVFRPPEIMKRVPSETVWKDLQIDDDDDAGPDDDDDNTYNGMASF